MWTCRSTTRRRAMVAVALVIVAGCGNGDTQSGATSASSTPDAAPTSASAPTSSSVSPVLALATVPVGATVPLVPGLPGGAPIEPGPAAVELCGERGWPVVAAYDLADGSLRWSACSPEGGLFVMAAASEDTVWVQHFTGTDQEYLAFDAGTGNELRRSTPAEFASDVPADADKGVETPPVIGGVQLAGGQQDPMTGTDAATGATKWTQPGHLAYDDVWAVGDGAVFAVENDVVPDKPTPPALVGYEVASGEVRWRHELAAYLWPFHVNGERLLVMWNNLQVLATDDGSMLWETHYAEPRSGFPRMMGGATNSKSVFVSFTSEPSGGD